VWSLVAGQWWEGAFQLVAVEERNQKGVEQAACRASDHGHCLTGAMLLRQRGIGEQEAAAVGLGTPTATDLA
jgi:ribosomal protein L27